MQAWAHPTLMPLERPSNPAPGCLVCGRSSQLVFSVAQAPPLHAEARSQQGIQAQTSADYLPGQDPLPAPLPRQGPDPPSDFPPIPRMLPPLAEIQTAPVHRVSSHHALAGTLQEDVPCRARLSCTLLRHSAQVSLWYSRTTKFASEPLGPLASSLTTRYEMSLHRLSNGKQRGAGPAPHLQACKTCNAPDTESGHVQAHLANGLQVYMMEDHEVPTVKAALLMKGGRHASPAIKVGAYDVISVVLAT